MAVRADGGGGVRRPKAPTNVRNPRQAGAAPSTMPNPRADGVSATPGAAAAAAGRAAGGAAAGARAGQWVGDPYNSGGGSGGGYNVGGGGMGGGGMGVMSAPVVQAPSEEDYLAGDAGYQTETSALQAALERYLADADFQRSTYETDYDKSLQDLGYNEDGQAWNWNDKLTASGRGYQQQLDDFAARGMLQSQGYADAFTELQRLLGQQYDALSGARTTFNTDLDNQIANYRGENTANQQAARAEAIQRRAAQYGL